MTGGTIERERESGGGREGERESSRNDRTQVCFSFLYRWQARPAALCVNITFLTTVISKWCKCLRLSATNVLTNHSQDTGLCRSECPTHFYFRPSYTVTVKYMSDTKQRKLQILLQSSTVLLRVSTEYLRTPELSFTSLIVLQYMFTHCSNSDNINQTCSKYGSGTNCGTSVDFVRPKIWI